MLDSRREVKDVVGHRGHITKIMSSSVNYYERLYSEKGRKPLTSLSRGMMESGLGLL